MPEEADWLTTSMISGRHEITFVQFQFWLLRFQPLFLLLDYKFIYTLDHRVLHGENEIICPLAHTIEKKRKWKSTKKTKTESHLKSTLDNGNLTENLNNILQKRLKLMLRLKIMCAASGAVLFESSNAKITIHIYMYQMESTMEAASSTTNKT